MVEDGAHETGILAMNAIMHMRPPQSGHSSGSNSKTFLMKRPHLPRAAFAEAGSSDSGIGPSGCVSNP